jgi:hypothetical protein
MAIDFARELRTAAGQAEYIGEKGLGELWEILEDSLTRIKDEVFGGASRPPADQGGQADEGTRSAGARGAAGSGGRAAGAGDQEAGAGGESDGPAGKSGGRRSEPAGPAEPDQPAGQDD